MVRVDDLLYTGDFNPEGGATCGRAQPEFVRDLIVDATYGRPGYNFPPKHDVESDLLNWLEMELALGPVALGGYEFGKSQELIALVNRLGVEVAVSDKIADLADLYGPYGVTSGTAGCPNSRKANTAIRARTSCRRDGCDRRSTTASPGSARSASR